MKKLFIYYTLTGNGDLVANVYKEKGYDIRKVINKHKYPKKMFPLMMMGGYRALFNKKDKLENFNNDINSYDEIVIGSPIWFDRLPPATNSVLDKLDLNSKKISFVFYSGSGEGNKAKEKINGLYSDYITFLKEPKKNKKELNKINK